MIFHWNSTVEALLHDEAFTGLRLRDKVTGAVTDLACDGVFVSIGRSPNTEGAGGRGQVELDPAGYVVADETTRTNLPGVFAVGDVRTKALRQVITAAADGAVASHYAEEYLAELGGEGSPMEYLISFLEGMITFLSPCLLPMLPIYLSYFAGGGIRSTGRTLRNALGFILGFTVVFVTMGALAGTVGSFLKAHQTAVNIVSGLIVIRLWSQLPGGVSPFIFQGKPLSC